jgi:hypothetical protein
MRASCLLALRTEPRGHFGEPVGESRSAWGSEEPCSWRMDGLKACDPPLSGRRASASRGHEPGAAPTPDPRAAALVMLLAIMAGQRLRTEPGIVTAELPVSGDCFDLWTGDPFPCALMPSPTRSGQAAGTSSTSRSSSLRLIFDLT